ncbi:hypothetical protein Goshw_000290 [Gossypium schwendimanii]|uniref:ENTH domain-containing protein n=1 Tax=Gossypium schwendimanii TaxID=34291 RepID=A0A7J9M161_GOSSC|nr:hypothetical protein [Gossypium schwendimanii]
MLWKLVSAAIKDNNSLIKAKFSRKDSCRNYDLEAAIIKVTSHDNYVIDRRNAQIVFSWIRASSISLRPFVWALSKRMEKTRSWVVALKGLMLMHGVLRCKVPAVQNMGRLPFDFSDFTDGHSKLSKTWGFNAFIRDYYAFLDKRAALSYDQHNQKAQHRYPLMLQGLLNVQNLQFLLGLLLKVRPLADNMNVGLIIEAMNCVTVEIFDVYSKICNEIAKVEYYGTPTNANELPTVTQILEEDVQQKLERIANGDSDKTCRDIGFVENDKMAKDLTKENLIDAIVGQIDKTKVSGLETIITDKWVVFYENLNVNGIKNINTVAEETAGKDLNLIPIYHYEILDLINF